MLYGLSAISAKSMIEGIIKNVEDSIRQNCSYEAYERFTTIDVFTMENNGMRLYDEDLPTGETKEKITDAMHRSFKLYSGLDIRKTDEAIDKFVPSLRKSKDTFSSYLAKSLVKTYGLQGEDIDYCKKLCKKAEEDIVRFFGQKTETYILDVKEINSNMTVMTWYYDFLQIYSARMFCFGNICIMVMYVYYY